MIDEFEFTLHEPLTKEDWEKLTDVELENTMSITFQTPQGRQVKYIKREVLTNIRAEIEQLPTAICTEIIRKNFSAKDFKEDVLKIIDKYKAEGSDKE